jgi:hypothetical protein
MHVNTSEVLREESKAATPERFDGITLHKRKSIKVPFEMALCTLLRNLSFPVLMACSE